MPKNTSAVDDMSVNARINGGNAGAYCARFGNLANGMVWLSNDGNNYYADTVAVSETATSVGVQVRGTLNTCSSSFRGGPADVYAINVSSGSPLLGISGTQFYRGTVPQGVALYAWASRGSFLNATLNVSGLAVCSAGATSASQTITVNVNRELMYVQNGVNLYRPPITPEPVDVRIIRSCPLPNYTLDPTISVTPNIAEGSLPVRVTPTVTNRGTTNSQGAQWQVVTFNVAPSAAIPGGGLSGNAPLTQFPGSTSVAQSAGSTVIFPPTTPINLGDIIQNLPDLPVGTRVCYVLSVQPYMYTNASWNHSTPICVTIAKSPKVHVVAGDLLVGRGSETNPQRTSNIITSVTSKGGAFYGSWAEYGIIPTGTVTGMASGSGYVGGAVTSDLCNLSILTFTVGGGGTGCGIIGRYTQTTLAPNVSARFPINVPAASASPSAPASPAVLPSTSFDIVGSNLSGHYQAPSGATAITITGGSPIPAGRWVVINAPDATVTIRGNIVYTNDPLAALADVPQVVIIARNIIIADSVTNIDAWLVATGAGTEGKVNTCGVGAPGITETSALIFTDCANKLTVNGPVIANHLIMRRTAGAGTGAASGDPSEVFNLRPDAYIWATNYNLSTGRLSTVATKELPPRF